MKQNVICIIQARMGSIRLPNKTMIDINGKPMLYHIINIAKAIKDINKIIIATSTNEEDMIIVKEAINNNIDYFQGDPEDVLDRFFKVSLKENANHIVRITADCPLIDPTLSSYCIEHHLENTNDYTSFTGLPSGSGIEVISKEALEKVHKLGDKKHHSELVSLFIKENPDLFKIQLLRPPEKFQREEIRLTIDEKEDLELIRKIYKELYNGKSIELIKVIDLLDSRPDLLKINKNIQGKMHNIYFKVLDNKLPIVNMKKINF